MSELELNCPHCRSDLIVEEHLFGKEINCPHCEKLLQVPRLRNSARTAEHNVSASAAQEAQQMARIRQFYDVRRKRRQNQRRRTRTMVADAVLIERANKALDILFPCCHCDAELVMGSQYSGFDVYCPACGELVEVPDIDDDDFGKNRLGQNPQDEDFLKGRNAHAVPATAIAEPGGWHWQHHHQTPRLSNMPSPPDADARPYLETFQAPGDSEHLTSAVTPDGTMMINIVMSPEGLSAFEKKAQPAQGRYRPNIRPGAGALKTPVKDISELALTGEGGRLEDDDLKDLWRGEIGARRWERIASIAVVALFLVTLLALGIFFLSSNEPDGPQLVQQDPAGPPPPSYLGNQGEIQFEKLEMGPEEMEEARFIVKNYLGSESWRERLAYVRRPDIVEPKMEEYYRNVGDGPIPHSTIELEWSGLIGDQYMLFLGVTDSAFRKIIYPLVKVDDTFKIDWETLVQHNPMTWKELKQQQPRDPLAFRVKLEPANYYNFEFSDRSIYRSYRISDLREFTGLYAYVRRDAPFAEKLELNGAPYKMAIVELQYPTDPMSRNLVEIVGFKQLGWLEDYREDQELSGENALQDASQAEQQPPEASAEGDQVATPVEQDFPPGASGVETGASPSSGSDGQPEVDSGDTGEPSSAGVASSP